MKFEPVRTGCSGCPSPSRPGPHPPRRPPSWCCPRPTRSTSISTRTTCRSTCSARRDRAASRSTPPTRRCASRTSRPVWWCRYKNERARSRTGPRPFGCCRHGCSRWSRTGVAEASGSEAGPDRRWRTQREGPDLQLQGRTGSPTTGSRAHRVQPGQGLAGGELRDRQRRPRDRRAGPPAHGADVSRGLSDEDEASTVTWRGAARGAIATCAAIQRRFRSCDDGRNASPPRRWALPTPSWCSPVQNGPSAASHLSAMVARSRDQEPAAVRAGALAVPAPRPGAVDRRDAHPRPETEAGGRGGPGELDRMGGRDQPTTVGRPRHGSGRSPWPSPPNGCAPRCGPTPRLARFRGGRRLAGVGRAGARTSPGGG